MRICDHISVRIIYAPYPPSVLSIVYYPYTFVLHTYPSLTSVILTYPFVLITYPFKTLRYTPEILTYTKVLSRLWWVLYG